MARPKKTHCPKGHPYEGDNVAVYKPQGLVDKFSYRICKTCSRERARAQQERKKAGVPQQRVGRPPTDTCPRGHPKTLENLLVSYTKKYRRNEEYWYPVKYCKICHREANARSRAKKREAKNNGTT